MKKTLLTLITLLGITFGAIAQPQGGGIFKRGAVSDEVYYNARNNTGENGLLNLPISHGEAQDQGAPLGSGIAVLLGLGSAYFMAKKLKED